MMTIITPRREATIKDLYKVPENDKAKIVNGELVLIPPNGDLPGTAGGEIAVSLQQHVVWDVNLLSEDVVRVYRSDNPDTPTIYHRGENAEAKPAVPDWSMPMDNLFE